MKFIVTCEVNRAFKTVADITLPIIGEYCERHGYDFRVKIIEAPVRSIVWDRVLHMQECLPECDWVVHIDADCLITNLNIPLTEFVEPNKSIVISCAEYQGKPMFNDGFIMVRNCSEAKILLKNIWSMDRPESQIFCAQDALWNLYSDTEWKWEFSVQPQKRFNSFLWGEYGETEYKHGQWTRGDYILHFPGRTNERRVDLLNCYLPEIVR